MYWLSPSQAALTLSELDGLVEDYNLSGIDCVRDEAVFVLQVCYLSKPYHWLESNFLLCKARGSIVDQADRLLHQGVDSSSQAHTVTALQV